MDILKAELMARDLIKKHKVNYVSFEWTHHTRKFGECFYYKSSRKAFLIQLSKPLTRLNKMAQVKETILHEIAHALTAGHGHDIIWQAKYKEIDGLGCKYYNDTIRLKTLGKVKLPKRKISKRGVK